MLIIAILLLVLTPLVVLLGGRLQTLSCGISLYEALSFLLILGADGLKAANSAALARLAGITLLVFGALLFVGRLYRRLVAVRDGKPDRTPTLVVKGQGIASAEPDLTILSFTVLGRDPPCPFLRFV